MTSCEHHDQLLLGNLAAHPAVKSLRLQFSQRCVICRSIPAYPAPHSLDPPRRRSSSSPPETNCCRELHETD
ncbi:hypothetical protein E2C01_057431 [Portunus trituberculatus]|uniref:Uncharacterized protein n=1 Tax=Portunus trituberculatus TaxID=210409 RepID=A0A5B7GZZ4_PORTR|nr:hypothetical protein [Portunus trituberculatus]